MDDSRTRVAVKRRPLQTLGAGAVAVLALAALAACGTAAAAPDDSTITASSSSASFSSAPPSAAPPSQAAAPTSPSMAAPDVVTATPATPIPGTDALALLATIPVKGRAPQSGYSREQFGQSWSDDVTVDGGHNGCDTRNDILRRDISDAQIKPNSNGCVVLSGTLADPYSGTGIPFIRGAQTSDDVQIDHVIALSDAWQTGAQLLSPEQRQNFANDPSNLQATAGWVNQQKGAGDAATWLPPNKGYRCTYIGRQIEVKAKYGLWVTPAERDAMADILSRCDVASPAFTTEPPTVTTEPPVEDDGGAFPNCAAARAAGAAPLHVGEPGYSTQLDGDRDGIACE